MAADRSLGDALYPKPTHPTLRGRIERVFAPGCGYCFRCGRPWTRVQEHQTPYKPEHGEHGCFPLCETCWASLTPAARLPYYERLVNLWIGQNPSDAAEYDRNRDLIRKAVLAGA